MTQRPSTAPQRVPLPSPPASSLPDSPDPESDSLCAASPTVTRFLATAVTDPLFESSAASALVAKLVDFAAACRLDFATSLVAESASASVCLPSVGGECALGTDVLKDKQEDFECFAAAVPPLVSMLLAPQRDPDAPDISTPRSYAEAIEGPYSSQWQAAMEAEMASWKSTGTYVDDVPPPGANIVSGMWIFRVKRPPGSPPVFKGSLHEEIWLRHSPGFSGSFPAGTQWSLWRPVYGLRQAPRDTDTTLPPFYVLLYVDDLVFATTDTEALAHGKFELQKRHTCTDLGELTSYLGLRITRDRAQRTITLTQSHMVQQVLQRFGFTYSSPQSTPLTTGHSLSAPPLDESVEPSGPYPELVGCLISSCEAEIYAGAMAAQELRWLTYLLTDLGERLVLLQFSCFAFLDWSLPPLPPMPAPPCLPCIEGQLCAAPHSSFPPMTAPLQTLHMDVWGPARVSGQNCERYFLLVVDDYTQYTTDLRVLRLHFDRGGEFSSDLLRDFCRGEGILQSFTLPDSPQRYGILERCIGLVMEVARTSMIHAAAPHFLWPFVVRYAAHQLNLWPCVSLTETSPTLRWTGVVGDALVFRV
ncbi:unnamed protein product [Closterium sp. NIES-53]